MIDYDLHDDLTNDFPDLMIRDEKEIFDEQIEHAIKERQDEQRQQSTTD